MRGRPKKLTRAGKAVAVRLAECTSLTNEQIADIVAGCTRDTLQKALQGDEDFRGLFRKAKEKEKQKYLGLMDELASGAETMQETCYYDAEENFTGKQTVKKKNAPSFDAARYLFERLDADTAAAEEGSIQIVLDD